MDIQSVLLTVLIIAAIAVCVVAVFALVEAFKTFRCAREFLGSVDSRLIPLLDKADVTIDAVNAELIRVDAIVTSIEEVSETVTSATNVVREATHAPSVALNRLGAKLGRSLRRRKKSQPTEVPMRVVEVENDDV